MKKTVIVVAALFIVTANFACKQRQEQKQQPVTYTPAAPPAQMQIDQLQLAAKQSPRSAAAWTNLGDALMDSQRFAEAIEAYDKTLALEPKNVNVLVDQGTCYRGIGKFDKAVEQYRKAIKIDPGFPNAHRNLGVVLSADLHKNKEGIIEFQRYLEILPNAPDAEAIRQSIRELTSGK
jgi:tetratricopeptide (TPR) repeat protein